MKSQEEIRQLLLEGLTDDQADAVSSDMQKVLIAAGAGSGKTEVMARRVAWWVGINEVDKSRIVAFTFTDKAAEEMKFRIRSWIEKIASPDETVSMGGMYIGTIHGFCLKMLRELWPDTYHNYEIIDDTGRVALVQRGYWGVLNLNLFKNALGNVGQFEAVKKFLESYDILQEYNLFDISLPDEDPPINLGQDEREWCERSVLNTDVGDSEESRAFSLSAARYYAYLRCRRFLDFSTSQSELMRCISSDEEAIQKIQDTISHLVVDEVQDVNPIQDQLINLIVGERGTVTSVGDHRQAIYGFRGGRVDIIGRMWEETEDYTNGTTIDLRENFRSTNNVIELANLWSGTISQVGEMETEEMLHGNNERNDYHNSHLGITRFNERSEEAQWISDTITSLVDLNNECGARHNQRHNPDRGITYSDIAILLRSSSDARTYMRILEQNDVPAIFRAGPDLFSQPEVLLVISAYAIAAGLDEFYGSDRNPKSLPVRINRILGCEPNPYEVIPRAIAELRSIGLPLDTDAAERITQAAEFMHERIANGRTYTEVELSGLKSLELKKWLSNTRQLRRVFHQKLYHMLLAEIEVSGWDNNDSRGTTALFHLGALSRILTSIEVPGWTSTQDFKYQVIALLQAGSDSGKTEETPLLVSPNAVTITTIHASKGLEFACVFLADVNAMKFPSNYAKRRKEFPFDGNILTQIAINQLSDNDNNDSERRLMYVALTRAERYLFITASGSRKSKFYKELVEFVQQVGGFVEPDHEVPSQIELVQMSFSRELRLATSFSDLRYYLECPHDFYLRKVLGFAPTIDQAFGYGKGVHNLLRAIHSDPGMWAQIADNPNLLESEIQALVDRGLFYLRYTTGVPADNLRNAGMRAVKDYVNHYSDELSNLEFEPEKEFETLLEEEQVLISGAIDVIRLDDPPRVTLVDFKSGNADNENASALDQEEMRLQIAIYAHAALQELEYQPERGLVRYIGENDPNRKESTIQLNSESIQAARNTALETSRNIKNREFYLGPSEEHERCRKCDFINFCGMEQAIQSRSNNTN